jgi:hypothetical protein
MVDLAVVSRSADGSSRIQHSLVTKATIDAAVARRGRVRSSGSVETVRRAETLQVDQSASDCINSGDTWFLENDQALNGQEGGKFACLFYVDPDIFDAQDLGIVPKLICGDNYTRADFCRNDQCAKFVCGNSSGLVYSQEAFDACDIIDNVPSNVTWVLLQLGLFSCGP